MSDNEWTPNETWEDALSRSKEIRSPSDVKPVKWSCNPERKWVHLTEREWIGLHDAFDALNKKLLALQDCASDLHFWISVGREAGQVSRSDLDRWLKRLEGGDRGVWPPAEPDAPESPDNV